MSQVSCGILKMIPDDCVSVGTHMCVCVRRVCHWMCLSLGLSSYKYFCIPSCETFAVGSHAVLFDLNTEKFIHVSIRKNKNPERKNGLLTLTSFAN